MLFSLSRNSLVFAILVFAGCSKANDGLVPVTGQVVVDGKPAVGAAIVFHPVDGGNGTHPLGQVDSNGDFQLTTIRSGDGAAPGEYKVTLTWYVSAPRKKSLEGEESPARNLIPDRYARSETTPLSATVRIEDNNPIRIEITTTRR
jgi:hypothetical protein